VEQVSTDAVELRTQVGREIAHLRRSGRARTPVGNEGFLHANRESDLQREQLSRRRPIDAEIARLPHSRFKNLLFALRVDNGRIACVLRGGNFLHEPQAILQQLKDGAHVCIHIGKCRSGARRRR
jgi:hypothetical protein